MTTWSHIVQRAGMPSRRNDVATQNVDYRFYHPTLAGNGIIAIIAGADTATAGTYTMTDDQGNTYANLVSDNDVGDGTHLTIFYAATVAAGTRRVRFQTSTTSQFQVCEIIEVWGIATSGTLVGSNHTNGSSATWAVPSFTPSAFPAVIVQAAICNTQGNMSSFSASPGELLGTNRIDAYASQTYVAASGAQTPTITSDNAGFQTCAVALKVDNAQGTPCPTNAIRCRSMQMYNTGRATIGGGPFTFSDQFPCIAGDLINGKWQGAETGTQADVTLTAFSDSINGSGYTRKTGIFFNGRVSGFYKIGATAGDTLVWTATQSVAAADSTMMLYDMQAPAGQPFVFDQEVTGSGTITGTSNYDTVTCTPSSSGVVFYQTQNAACTVSAMSGANFFIDNGSSPDEDGGPSSFHEDNGWGHSTVGGLATWIVNTPSAQPDIGTWSAEALSFTLSGGSSAISLSEDGYMPSAAPAPGPLITIY